MPEAFTQPQPRSQPPKEVHLGLAPTSSHRREAAGEPGGNQKRPVGGQAGEGEAGPWGDGARPGHQDLARPRGVEPVGSSVSTVLTSAVPSSNRPAGIVGIPRLCLGSRRRCGVHVSVMDTDAPPGRCQRPAPQLATTLKVPIRPAIPAARSSIILASWRRVRQFSGMPLRP